MTSLPEKDQGSALVAEPAVDVTPHHKAVYEAGKALMVNSVTTSRDFAKFMISICAGAVPGYLALLKFVLPEKYTLSFWSAVIAIVPAAIFLLASGVFMLAYFPQADRFSLDIVEETERAISSTLQSRRRMTIMGFVVFLVGSAAGIAVIFLVLTRTLGIGP